MLKLQKAFISFTICACFTFLGTSPSIAKNGLTDNPSPVSVIGREDFEQSGITNVSDILGQLPNAVVLVNGSRQKNGNANEISFGHIEKIEVLKDGASAIWGTDATPGVVNIITDDSMSSTGNVTATSVNDLFSGFSGLKLAYDSPKWCNHWGDVALLPFGFNTPAGILTQAPTPSTQTASNTDPFTGKKKPNAYDLNLQNLTGNYLRNITGRTSEGFDNPTDWFSGNPLSPTFVRGLILIKDMYWKQLTEMRNQLQQLLNLSDEGRMALYDQLYTDATALREAYVSLVQSRNDAHKSRQGSQYSWEDMYDSLISQAAKAEKLGNKEEALELRNRANGTIWAVYLRARSQFAALLDANPLLALKADGDFLFNRIIELEDEIAVPTLGDAVLDALPDSFSDDDDTKRDKLLTGHLSTVITELDETRETVTNERDISDLVQYAGGQFLRQQQAVSLMGVQQGGTFAGQLMGEVSAVHEALEADDVFWNGVVDGTISTLAAGSLLIPVVGPFLSGGFALIEVSRDGTDMVIKYVELSDAEATAALTGHTYIIKAEDAASAATDRFIFTTLTAMADIIPAVTNIKVIRGNKADAASGVKTGTRAAGTADDAAAAIARNQDALPAGAKPHVTATTDADSILNRIDDDALAARFREVEDNAEDLADFLKKNGLEPKETIVAGGKTYHVSAPYKGPDGRTTVMVLQETGSGTVVPRTFYLSGEHGVWRNAPGIVYEPGGRMISKGPVVSTGGAGTKATNLNEGVVDIAGEMQGSLDDLVGNYGIKELDNTNDVNRAATAHLEHTTPDKGLKEFDATVKSADAAQPLIRETNGNLPEGMRPNWEAGPKSSSAIDNHPLYGRLERFVYLSEDGTALWVINRAENGDVWIGSLQDAQAGLTGFGTRGGAFKADDITTQPFTKNANGTAYEQATDWQNPFNQYAKGQLPAPNVASAPSTPKSATTAAPAQSVNTGSPLNAVNKSGESVPVRIGGGAGIIPRTLMRLEDHDPQLPLDGVVHPDTGYDKLPMDFSGNAANFNINLPLLNTGNNILNNGRLDVPINTSPRASSVLHLDIGASEDALKHLSPELKAYYARSFSGNPKMVVLRHPESRKSAIEEEAKKIGAIFMDTNTCRTKQRTPTDNYFKSSNSWGHGLNDQWSLEHIGLGATQKDIWGKIEAGKPVIVAVIDSGLDWFHKDFNRENIWTNKREVPDNGLDDDGNGYIDDVIGWDFIDDDNKPWDRDGHGTFVSGLIAAAHNNTGIAGINPNARIMVLRALNSFGNTRASFLAEAIFYASDNGARVINISAGGQQVTRTEKIAIDYAVGKGVLVIVAAGNEGLDVSNYGIASYSKVITVGASNHKDEVPAFSNHGNIDLVAPGVDILSLRGRRTDLMLGASNPDYVAGTNIVGKDKRYIHATGTSFAAPLVTGLASLLFSQNPELDANDVRRILLQSSRDIGTPGADPQSGLGLLDADAALHADPQFFINAKLLDVSVAQIKGEVLVRVTGVADADRFKQARLEIGAGETPTDWKVVVDEVSKTATANILGDIPAQQFTGSKKWTIRLVTEHEHGKTREHRFLLELG